jgi:NAD(P)-dependent dehydrogenase (short-subunit alcohol dehydrogenase family)
MVDLPEDDWEAAIRVNVTAPMLLTRRLLSTMQPGSRVLHISSGAAHSAFGGMGSYCATKAALLQLCRAWRADRDVQNAASESGGDSSSTTRAASLLGIRFGSARPGIVDTAMQVQGREADSSVFASAAMFREWKERGDAIRAAAGDAGKDASAATLWVAPPEGGLDTPGNCGRFLAWLLLDVGEEEYEATDDWDIRTTTPPSSA